MNLSKENVSRKIDSLGRLSIPKSLRDRLERHENDMVDFYLLQDEDRHYVCFGKHIDDSDEKVARAIKLLEELGIKVPDELIEKA